MANEISLNWSLKVRNPQTQTAGVLQYTHDGDRRMQLTQATAGGDGDTFGATTSEIALPTSKVSTLGITTLDNLDDVNFLQLGIVVGGDFYPVLQFKAKEGFPFRLDPACVPYVKGDTATVPIQYKVLED